MVHPLLNTKQPETNAGCLFSKPGIAWQEADGLV
jgi:hypothetical protein